MNDYTFEDSKAFAETVLTQLGGNGRVSAMIGVKHIIAETHNDLLSVVIRFKAKSANQSNAVRITLDPKDVYIMEFLSIRSGKVKSKGIVEGVYCDTLIETFEEYTQLYLHL